MNDDLISRQAAIDSIEKYLENSFVMDADIVLSDICYKLSELPSAERRGKWIEKHHAYSDEEMPIEEWQSARCSVCGKYHTTPYLYYFTEYKFCPNCGAKMITDKDDTQ